MRVNIKIIPTYAIIIKLIRTKIIKNKKTGLSTIDTPSNIIKLFSI